MSGDEHGKHLKPATHVIHGAYNPRWAEGAAKCPIFETSTWVFPTAEEGERFFSIVSGASQLHEGEFVPLAYSRINHPGLEIAENRLVVWDGAEDCAVFASGTAAISGTLLEFLEHGDVLLHNETLYGGTLTTIRKYLPRMMNITPVSFSSKETYEEILEKVARFTRQHSWKRIGCIFIETPTNPLNEQVDIALCVRLRDALASDGHRPLLIVDNTFASPIYQSPLKLGADLVIYSLTKYVGGQSRMVGGACLGQREHIKRLKAIRGSFLGSVMDPHTCSKLLDGMETLELRMERHAQNAKAVAQFLNSHPLVKKVYFPELFMPGDPQHEIYHRQCTGPGAVVSFDIDGGKKEAFRFLNSLKVFKLAVSLGGTESLAEHPARMTHAGVDSKERERIGITDSMVRLAIGIEDVGDLITDLSQALEQAKNQ